MVCRNCGADLKPGIKYCLECGNYIDEDEYNDYDNEVGTMSGGSQGYELANEEDIVREEQVVRPKTKPAKKKRKMAIKPFDLLIYAGLSLIIIVSIIVIIVAIIGGNEPDTPETPVLTGDVTINLNNYQITLPKALNYDIQGSILFVSDGVNYTFSYKNTTDDYKSYADNETKLRSELSENNYEVVNIEKKTINEREFVVCQIKINGKVKYLYLTPLTNATTMGVIEVYENGNYESALGVIADINNKISYDSVGSNTYGNNTTTQ